MKKFDVIIIGGGHNGLVASSYLAKKGKKVLVIEKNEHVGGLAEYANSLSCISSIIKKELNINIPNIKFNKCCPLKIIGEPDIIPLSFKKAIIEPEKVIAPTAAPIDISIKLPSLIFPGEPKLNASGFKKAAIATNTAARPTKL